MSGRLRVEFRDSSTARVPAPEAGQALIFTRYHQEQAVVLNPSDFQQLAELDAALSALPELPLSDLAVRTRQIEDTPPGDALPARADVLRLLGRS